MMLALWERALPVSQLTLVSWPLSDRLYLTLIWSSCPQRWLAVLAEKSSDNERKIFVRKVWSRVRQLSPGNADRRELMLWVAMNGSMQQDVLPLPIAPKMAIPVNKPRSGIVSQEGALAGTGLRGLRTSPTTRKRSSLLLGSGYLGRRPGEMAWRAFKVKM